MPREALSFFFRITPGRKRQLCEKHRKQTQEKSKGLMSQLVNFGCQRTKFNLKVS